MLECEWQKLKEFFKVVYCLCSLFPLTVNFMTTFENKASLLGIHDFGNSTHETCETVISFFNISGFSCFLLGVYTVFYKIVIGPKIRDYLIHYAEDRKLVKTCSGEYSFLVPFHVEEVPYYADCTNTIVRWTAHVLFAAVFGFSFVCDVLLMIFCDFAEPYDVVTRLFVSLSLFLDTAAVVIYFVPNKTKTLPDD